MKKIFSILIFVIATLGVSAQVLDKPNPPKLVVDDAGVLSGYEEEKLEKKLVKYDDTTSTQIVVVFIQSLKGMDIFTYAQDLYEKWGIGGAKNNNGVLILASIGDRKMRIHTGYGVEALITDGFSHDVIEDILKPAFKNGQYYQGVDEASTAIMQKLAGTYKGTGKKANWLTPLIILIVIIIIIILIAAISGKNNSGNGGGSDGSGLGNILFWAALNTLANSGRGGGSSNWGGGGDGGFGGFGGGHSGGGGASGSW